MPAHSKVTLTIQSKDAGLRLDTLLAAHLQDHSRAFAANLIRHGHVRVRGKIVKPSYRVRAGDHIEGDLPAPAPMSLQAEPIPLEILYEDAHLIAINKPAGMVVHPAPGHARGTLVNALLHHCRDLQGIGDQLRPGIVHRLDKDTSGTMVAAKSAIAHAGLSAQFKSRTVHKQYWALVHGVVPRSSGRIQLAIGRHPVHRKKMSTVSRKGRAAETHWRVKERFTTVTWLELELKTGRTHQIRVHCAAMNHPLLGDATYGRHRGPRKPQTTKAPTKALIEALSTVTRQMLHAWRLAIVHPVTQASMRFESPPPRDMTALIARLRHLTQ